MNILYLIDPNSIHDQKWISKFTQNHQNICFFICRAHHYQEKFIKSFEIEYNINFVGTVDYFSFKRIRDSIRQILKIKKIIKEEKIQLFHIQFAEPNALWVLFRRFLGIPIIITCRGTDVLKTIPNHFSKKDPFNKLISWAYKNAFRAADWITVTSEGQKKSIETFSGKKDKINIIRTGVNLQILLVDSSSFFPNGISKPFLLFPRYLKPIYNHEFSIEALKMLPLAIKKKYQMVFVGKDAGDLNYQNELIEQLESDQYLDYVMLPKQKQESIWELYKRAEVIIMTPKSDGSPVSGMEALALRKKLILGPLKYDQDIFENSKAFKLNSWSYNELASLIETVIHENYAYSKPSMDYLNKIDRNHNMLKLEKIYKKLIDEI